MGPAKKKARTTTIELKGVPSDGKFLNYRGHAYAACGGQSFQYSADSLMRMINMLMEDLKL